MAVAWLPDDVRAEVERWVGPIVAAEDRSWPHGVTRVWRVTAAAEVVWIKQHSQARKYEQEAAAYAEVVPGLRSAGVRVPGWVGRADGLRVLALTDLPGSPARVEHPAVHRQAGAALAALHALPMTRHDPLSVADALRARLVRWIDEADGVLDDATIDRVAAEFDDPSLFVGCRRAWCHRDFSPRNWLEDGGVFGLIDFEHCGPDLPLFDLVKLADDAWRRFPATRDALFEGYGRRLSPEDAERLQRLMWLHALSTTAWASTHGDAEYERHGRALLSALHAGWAPAG